LNDIARLPTGQALASRELDVRKRIAQLEAAISRAPQMDFSLKHTFTAGVYCREIYIPKGSVIVGKIHRHEHLNFISKGHVTVLTKAGLQEFRGPCTMVSSAGTKRALYAHEDTVWTTIHANPTNERDLGKLEELIISPDYDSVDKEMLRIVGHEVAA